MKPAPQQTEEQQRIAEAFRNWIVDLLGGWAYFDAADRYYGDHRPIREVAPSIGLGKSAAQARLERIRHEMSARGIEPRVINPSYAKRWKPAKEGRPKTSG